MSRNITITLDEDTIREARVVAARRGLSLSALLREELRRLVREQAEFRQARTEAEARLREGAHLGGGPLPPREELHDRAGLR